MPIPITTSGASSGARARCGANTRAPAVPSAFEFNEVHRTRDAIELLNLTPRPEIPEWKTMVVSLPVCGGKARYAVGIPERWDDLFEVWTASN